MPKHQQAPLDKLLTLAQGYAELAMRNIGHAPPALQAESPSGLRLEARAGCVEWQSVWVPSTASATT